MVGIFVVDTTWAAGYVEWTFFALSLRNVLEHGLEIRTYCLNWGSGCGICADIGTIEGFDVGFLVCGISIGDTIFLVCGSPGVVERVGGFSLRWNIYL